MCLVAYREIMGLVFRWGLHAVKKTRFASDARRISLPRQPSDVL